MNVANNKPISQVAIIGTGVIGASWAALLLAKGLDVVATDIGPNAEAALKRFVDAAWPALERLGLAHGASPLRLAFTANMPEAVKGVGLVQENGPERIDFKKKLYGQLDELLPPDVIIASSSSGLTMSEIQSGCPSHPERCVIAHPFNPPHLIPLSKLSAAQKRPRRRSGAPLNSILLWASGPSVCTRKCRACRQSSAGRFGPGSVSPGE